MNSFNPIIGIECERNLSKINGHYFKETSRTEATWKSLGEDQKRKAEGKFDVETQKPTGSTVTLSSGAKTDIVTDTGYNEVEIASTVYSNLIQAGKDMTEAFQIILEHSNKSHNEECILLGIGAHPFLEATPENYFKYRTPKGHLYTLLCEGSEHAPGRNWSHHHYLTLTSDQTNIDLPAGKESEVMKNINRVMGLLVALSANSPFENGKLASHKSIRQAKQSDLIIGARSKTDIHTVGMPVIEPKNLEWHFQKMWNERQMFFHGGNKSSFLYVILNKDGESPTFREFLEQDHGWDARTVCGKSETIYSQDVDILSAIQRISLWNVKPQINFSKAQKISKKEFTKALKEQQIKELFDQKGVKIYTEIRAIDSSLPGEEIHLAAFIKGLVINHQGLTEFAEKSSSSYEDWKEIYQKASKSGLAWKQKGKSSSEWCQELYTIAYDGLKSVNDGSEIRFIEPLAQRIKDQRCPADELISAFEKKNWDGVIQKIAIHSQSS